MDIVFQIIFWTSFLALFHSYVIYPFLIKTLGKKLKEPDLQYSIDEDNLPNLSIILASYNEEKHIERKIKSTLNTCYPINKIEFLIGSDHSSDKTAEIIKKYSEKYSQIQFYDFKERKGKIEIINILEKKAKNKILIFTDTKVFFKKNTIYNLVKFFKDDKISLIGGFLKNHKKNNDDISHQEDVYMNNELMMKYYEGLLWGCSMGVFGAIYAIRKENFRSIPKNFLVDDFFITLNVLKINGKVIFAKNSIADENLTGDLRQEFKRKIRISIGNFQNLNVFKRMLLKPFKLCTFAFFSHKVIRWIGPVLLSLILISLILLVNIGFYQIMLILFITSIFLPLIDIILKINNINIYILRFITHFYIMNLALGIGLIKYIIGNYDKVWEPSIR